MPLPTSLHRCVVCRNEWCQCDNLGVVQVVVVGCLLMGVHASVVLCVATWVAVGRWWVRQSVSTRAHPPSVESLLCQPSGRSDVGRCVDAQQVLTDVMYVLWCDVYVVWLWYCTCCNCLSTVVRACVCACVARCARCAPSASRCVCTSMLLCTHQSTNMELKV